MRATAVAPEFPRLNAEKTGFFRFRRFRDGFLVTNDFGRHHVLTAAEFKSFVEGSIDASLPLHAELSRDGFIRDQMDFEALTSVWRTRNRFLWQGPSLHIVVVTLRCNHRCLYCQANSVPMKDESSDMSLKTARKVVNRIFETASPSITLEFQGGEPLANWPTVEFIVDYARRKNRKSGKSLWINLVTNLSLLDDAKLKFLLKNRVNFCTSIDGPEELHNKNRLYVGGDSHADAVRWFKVIHKKTEGKAFQIDALLTVTRFSLTRHKEIVDEYAGLGLRGIYLRPLSRLGLARETWDKIGYEPEEFLAFYRRALDYIIGLNKRGPFFEQTARLFLTKILGDNDPNFLDLRSPCGAGIGQIAYNFDGRLYTCDEGRMLSRMGDESFRIGAVDGGSYRESVSHPAVRAVAVASGLDNQVQCHKCAYKPFCGVCPIQCYAEQGDIMGRMPSNTRCRINMGILDALFERLQDPGIEKIFRQWILERKEPALYQR
ncbi:MAG: His-Xaa-Ser system radical SAM maturase HxsB [Elusimicrobiota bacterium]